MIKYKYQIDAGNFTSITAFKEYLNRMGKNGYELVQWQMIDFNAMILECQYQPVSGTLPVLITWKIESSE